MIYQGKKSQLLDFSVSGETYSWNQGLDGGEISYSVEPYRIHNQLAQFPTSLIAQELDSGKLEFISAGFTFDPTHKKLWFLAPPKLIYSWSEGKWVAMQTKDMLEIDSLAYRILF